MTTPDTRPADDGTLRRTAFKGGLAALLGLALVRKATAATPAHKPQDAHPVSRETADRVEITDVLLRERQARETHNTDVGIACFTPDASVEVSWFKGTAADFVASGKRQPPPHTASFDSLSPPLIWIKGDRALADASCAVHQALRLNDVEAICISYMRLLWRIERVKGKWLIAGLRGYYIRDTLQADGPDQTLTIDAAKLAGYRESYRYLSYVLATIGRPVSNDLPGMDQPDTVAALRAGEQAWFNYQA